MVGTIILIMLLIIAIGNAFPEEAYDSDYNVGFAYPMIKGGLATLFIAIIIFYFCG